MPTHLPPLECSQEDKIRLSSLRASRTEDPRLVQRAKIVLARIAGKEIRKVARDLNVSVPTVTKWCKRFSLRGISGLWDDPRPGKPPRYDMDFSDRVLGLLVQSPPPPMPAWDGHALAERLGASVDSVWRVLRREGIYLRRRRSWRVITDTALIPKVADAVGLYLNPPFHAFLLNANPSPAPPVNELLKTYVETDTGAVARALAKARRRDGVLRLPAAVKAGAGRFQTPPTERQKRADFREFLESLIAAQPPESEIHAIVDSGSINREWLAALGGRVRFYFTPALTHWLSLIEIVIGILSGPMGEAGVDDKTIEGLRKAIELFIRDHNEYVKPFRWRKGEIQRGGELENTLIN